MVIFSLTIIMIMIIIIMIPANHNMKLLWLSRCLDEASLPYIDLAQSSGRKVSGAWEKDKTNVTHMSDICKNRNSYG